MAAFPRIREAKPNAAMGFDIDVEPDGILDVRIRGVWTRPDVDRFFDALESAHEEVRGGHGAVLALITVDIVQQPDVALYVRDRALAIKRHGDRNAFIVATFLSRLQIKRLASNHDFGLFTDRATAVAWLKG